MLPQTVSLPFRREKDGRIVFFPFGSWNKGYVISSESQFSKVRKFIKVYWTIGLLSLIVPTLMGWVLWQALLWFLALLIIYAIVTTKIVQGFEVCKDHRTLRESLRNRARKTPWNELYIYLPLCLILCIGSIFMVMDEEVERYVSVTSVAVFGGMSLLVIYAMVIKKSRK
jgi:hypothetical protein